VYFFLEKVHSTRDLKYYVESSAAAKQQGLVFASLPSEASIARLKLQAFVKEGRWRGKIHGMVQWIAGDSAADAVVQVVEDAIRYFTED